MLAYNGLGLADVPALAFRLLGKLFQMVMEEQMYSSAGYWQAHVSAFFNVQSTFFRT